MAGRADSTAPLTDSRAQTTVPTKGRPTQATYSQPARLRPRRTASVRFPLTVSVPMSRRLLASSRAVATRPTAAPANHTTVTPSSRVCT